MVLNSVVSRILQFPQWEKEWVNNKKKSVSVRVSADFINERDLFGEISEVNLENHDIATISGTGLKSVNSVLIDDISEHKLKNALIESGCYHYPQALLPQRHSKGYVALKSICSQLPLVHHDLVSFHGSSGAGIRDDSSKIFAVLCSGPACHTEFPQRKYNHCIPVDNSGISRLNYDIVQEDKMRFASLASILLTLSFSNAFSADDDLKSAVSGNVSRQGIFRHLEPTSDGLVSGTYTPHNPPCLWRRTMVFSPSIRMVRMPLIIGGAIPSYFLLDRYFRKA